MADFGQFFDDEIAKRNQASELQAVEAKRKAEEEAERLRVLAAPLDRFLDPAFVEAEGQLANRGIEIVRNVRVSMNIIGGFPVHRTFKLQRKRADRGTDLSGTYGFKVYPNGNIEGLLMETHVSSNNSGDRIFLASPEELTYAHVISVFEAAIKDLVHNAR